MAKTFALFNQKGGVGKTTTAINLSAGVARLGRKVLLIDMDPQGNATSGMGVNSENFENTLYDVIANNLDISETIISIDNTLSLLPADPNLVGLEVMLARERNWEQILKDRLSKVSEEYDYIFIDCPPSLGFLSILSLVAANSVLIPIQSEYYALEGVSHLFNTIELVKANHNNDLDIDGVIMTMVDMRNNLAIQVIEEVRGFFKEKLYETMVPRNVRLAEAPSFGQSIYNYDRLSKGAQAYKKLSQEFLKRQGESIKGKRFFGLFNV
ncbi:MAG: ParA family protein [Tissierellia bacterium]|nr:ParA family protein [Tissierellia bacterium]